MPSRCLRSLVSVLVLLSLSLAESNTAQPAMSPPQNGTPSQFQLQEGTPIKLRTNRTLSSADAKTGDQVDFEVLEEVRVNGGLVVAKGGTAMGTVTQAEAKRRMGRGGKLDITIDYVRLIDGEKAALRAVKETKGGGHTGAMTAGIVATSLIVWPAAPFFLFMHGKDITIPKDTEITAYVNGDMPLDATKFQLGGSSQTPSSTSMTGQDQKSSAQLEITSTPSGAEVEIDGNFVGSTPSSVGITAGQHEIVVKKKGFDTWEKKVSVSTGNINVNAELSPNAK
jgi:PEGA domain